MAAGGGVVGHPPHSPGAGPPTAALLTQHLGLGLLLQVMGPLLILMQGLWLLLQVILFIYLFVCLYIG